MAKEGVTSLYKGIGPAMLRAFPANAVSTVVALTNSIHYCVGSISWVRSDNQVTRLAAT